MKLRHSGGDDLDGLTDSDRARIAALASVPAVGMTKPRPAGAAIQDAAPARATPRRKGERAAPKATPTKKRGVR